MTDLLPCTGDCVDDTSKCQKSGRTDLQISSEACIEIAIKGGEKETRVTESSLIAIEGTLHSIDGKGVVRMKVQYETDIDELWAALTNPKRLARWYGEVAGNLRAGGEYTALISISGWDGRGRIDLCDPPHRLHVTTWEEVGKEQVVEVTLNAVGNRTNLEIEVRGVPLDLAWAYGSGWHIHADNLGTYLAGHECTDSETRWDELESTYRQMSVEPL